MENMSHIREKDITTISSRGQLVIPKSFRQKLGIKAGDTIGLIRMGDLVVMKRLDFEEEKISKTVKTAERAEGFTFEELLYPEK
jgi:AbrB family looped-hinge helix DNA binding protein